MASRSLYGTVFLLVCLLEVSSFNGIWSPRYQQLQRVSVSNLHAAMQIPVTKSTPGDDSNEGNTNANADAGAADVAKRYHTEAFPWGTSVVPDRELTYMRMAMHQLNLLKQLGFEQVDLGEVHGGRTSIDKHGRLLNMHFKNSVFRKVRMTYFDAGNHVQVFNTLWYPRYEYDAPMLGIDLISLGKNRVLNVLDFQPIQPDREYAEKYIKPLKDIRSRYAELQGTLSGKIYDDVSFFSEGMLFGRFKDESQTQSVVLPAFKETLAAYVDLCSTLTANTDPESMRLVQDRQRAYDTYSAAKDPAVGIFGGYFGAEWAHEFIHKFLFELSEPTTDAPTHNFHVDAEGKTSVVVMGQKGEARNPHAHGEAPR